MAAQFLLNGTNGAALASPLSPDSGSGYVLIPDGSTHTYSTAQKYQGTASLVGTDSGSVWVDDGGGWPYTNDTTATYADFFFFLNGTPTSDKFIIGGVYLATAGLYVTTDKRLAFKDSGGTVRGQTSANAVPASSWVRIRVRYDTTLGIDYAWLWTANFTTDDPSAAGATTLAATASMAMGYIAINPTAQFYLDDLVIAPTSGGNTTHPAGATTHTADASVTATATRTATATGSKPVDAARTATATVAATATRATLGDAASVATATVAATASAAKPVDVAETVTATITATMDVSGSSSAAAAVSVTATATATMAVERFADAALAVAATTAVDAVREALVNAAITVTASRAATASSTYVEPTAGTMRPVSMRAATITPATGAADVPRMVGLVSLDAATMRAVFVDATAAPITGQAVFVGGSVSPEAAGLIAGGVPYVWFKSATEVYVEDGS